MARNHGAGRAPATSGRRWLPRGLEVDLRPRHPAQVVSIAFLVGIAVATLLLRLPVASAEGSTSWLQALFTATSAVCVTGLAVVDTGAHWSGLGQAVILAGIQVGGIGIMTLASVLALIVSRRLGLRSRLLTQTENAAFGLGDVRSVVLAVLRTSLVIEVVVALLLAARFALAYDMGVGTALWQGVFHSVSAFNQAGFALSSAGLADYVADPWVCFPVIVAIVLGGLGFPVLVELLRERRTPQTWSLHTKITVAGSAVLLVGGAAMITAFEWSNPGTLGPLSWPQKLLAGLFHGVQPRSAGFNTVDYGQMRDETWLGTDALMFIGGGSASTAGGIKVTTFFVLLFAIVAEARGDAHVQAFRRRIPPATLRLAVSVALLGVAWVFLGTLLLLALTEQSLDRVLFESVSAFGTAGASTGITATLPQPAQYVLVVLMFVGRVGIVTAASALALRERKQLYAYPEERTLIG
ncbi:TrkH family potassium uptake protein [Motilibacter aurantiacus]|uniref:TrkH family potassium uptake protein n=1 Tax=Motilibacter aurantiacus TaxID=2714955 RepID=UPI00140A69FC|nr:potassium transporter TrkG [Motilibacter aurantiacus]NHC45504.1 TrkH family potassium uptake protein [Motilibacter aurantiacus]